MSHRKVGSSQLHPVQSLGLFSRNDFISWSNRFCRWSSLFATSLFLFSGSANSATSLVGYSNYFYTTETVDATTVKIYAGSTGNAVQPAGSADTPGNSCTGSQFANVALGAWNPADATVGRLVCSTAEIYPSLRFSFTIKSDQTTAYPASCSNLLLAKVGSTVVNLDEVSPATYSAGVANQEITGTVLWSSTCAAAGLGACTSSGTFTLNVGFNKDCGSSDDFADGFVKFNFVFRYVDDSDYASTTCNTGLTLPYEGFCSFKVFPGDEKVFLSDLVYNASQGLVAADLTTSSTPTTSDASGMKYAGVRLFFVEGNGATLAATALSGTTTADFPFSEGTSLKTDFVSGLKNGSQYSFIMASVDQAGIATFFTNPALLNYNTTPLGDTQAAIPQPVTGLLDGKKCFVATAAFGSELDPRVESFRQLRDQYLLKNPVGLWLVSQYYTHSPQWAHFIADHPILKSWVRSQLWLLLLITQIILTIGLWPTVFLSALFIFFFQRQLFSLR